MGGGGGEAMAKGKKGRGHWAIGPKIQQNYSFAWKQYQCRKILWQNLEIYFYRLIVVTTSVGESGIDAFWIEWWKGAPPPSTYLRIFYFFLLFFFPTGKEGKPRTWPNFLPEIGPPPPRQRSEGLFPNHSTFRSSREEEEGPFFLLLSQLEKLFSRESPPSLCSLRSKGAAATFRR